MDKPTTPESRDRVWHIIWALAGVAALTYGIVGIVAQFSQPNRHILGLPWFIIAAVGGLSMISFVWKSHGD